MTENTPDSRNTREETAGKSQADQADRAYQMMFDTAVLWLQEKNPQEIARRSGAVYDEEARNLRLSMMGRELQIAWPSCTITPRPENWQVLVLLHYLNLSDGMPATGEKFSFRDMKDGLVRGSKFEFTADRALGRMLKGKSEAEILSACAALGGTPSGGKGDVNVCIPFLPHLPVYLSVWLADEEFPVSGHLYPDRSIDHCLMIEDAVTVGEIILRELEKAL